MRWAAIVGATWMMIFSAPIARGRSFAPDELEQRSYLSRSAYRSFAYVVGIGEGVTPTCLIGTLGESLHLASPFEWRRSKGHLFPGSIGAPPAFYRAQGRHAGDVLERWITMFVRIFVLPNDKKH